MRDRLRNMSNLKQNKELVSSHPGVADPGAFVIVTSWWAANALGAIATRETTDKRTKSELSVLIFMWSRKAFGIYIVFDISTICKNCFLATILD